MISDDGIKRLVVPCVSDGLHLGPIDKLTVNFLLAGPLGRAPKVEQDLLTFLGAFRTLIPLNSISLISGCL